MSKGFKIKWLFTFVIKCCFLALVPWRSLLKAKPAILCLLLPWLSCGGMVTLPLVLPFWDGQTQGEH